MAEAHETISPRDIKGSNKIIDYTKSKKPPVILSRALDDSTMPATARQYRYIALLSSKLNKPEPRVKTRGEAGRLIRELQAELKHRTGRGI